MQTIHDLINVTWNTPDWEQQLRLLAPTLSLEDARALRLGILAKQEQALTALPKRILNANNDTHRL